MNARSPMMVHFMILGLSSADGGMTVGLRKLSSLDGRGLRDTSPGQPVFTLYRKTPGACQDSHLSINV